MTLYNSVPIERLRYGSETRIERGDGGERKIEESGKRAALQRGFLRLRGWEADLQI